MVRFNCVRGWCHRTGIVLDSLPLLTIQRCFTTQTCPLCWGTTPAPIAAPPLSASASRQRPDRSPSPEQRTLVIGGGTQGVKRFKRTHPRLAGYLGNRRPTLLHGMRMKVTTCDRGERTARGGEDLSDDGAGDGDGDGDDDDDGGAAPDVGFVDAPMADDADAALLLADDNDPIDDDSSDAPPQQHTLDDHDGDSDGAGAAMAADDDDDIAEDDDDGDASSAVAEAEAVAAVDEGDQCIVCGRGWRYPLCRQCASNIRKRARVLLKI